MKVTAGSLPHDDKVKSQLRAEAEEFQPQTAERGVDEPCLHGSEEGRMDAEEEETHKETEKSPCVK